MSDEAKVEALPEGTRFRHRTASGFVEVEVLSAPDSMGFQGCRWRPERGKAAKGEAYRKELRAWYEAREPEAAVLKAKEGPDGERLIDDYMATLPARESVALAPSSYEAADLLATFDAPVTPEALEFSVLSKPPPGAVEALAHQVEFVKTLPMWIDDTASPWLPLAMLPSGEGDR